MHRRNNPRRKLGPQNYSTLARNTKARSKKSLARRRTEANKDAWPNDAQFRLQPWPTGSDVARIGLLVNAPFATGLPFKVFHRICDVDRITINPGLLERSIQDLTSRSDERLAGQILLIAGLFAKQHERRFFPSPRRIPFGSRFCKVGRRCNKPRLRAISLGLKYLGWLLDASRRRLFPRRSFSSWFPRVPAFQAAGLVSALPPTGCANISSTSRPELRAPLRGLGRKCSCNRCNPRLSMRPSRWRCKADHSFGKGNLPPSRCAQRSGVGIDDWQASLAARPSRAYAGRSMRSTSLRSELMPNNSTKNAT